MKHLRGKELWQRCLEDQRKWIETHGGDRAGYIANYHEKHGRTLENAEAIYEADLAALHHWEELLGIRQPESGVPANMPPTGAFAVALGQDGVTINFNGACVLFWDYTELEQDEETGPQVAEAIRQAYRDPAKLYQFLYKKEKLPGQAKH